ncbi:hypothetical protein BDW22DRAFT_1014178 [Trametopsis cervina]|nr:hypothetical protein BDW22DRAFT_1014178 [Trametopsis cervina]
MKYYIETLISSELRANSLSIHSANNYPLPNHCLWIPRRIRRPPTSHTLYASRLEAMSVSIEQANTQTQAAKKLAAEREVVISKIRSEDMEMRDNLASTEYRLANLESRNIDLTALVTRYQEELEQGGQHRAEISGALARSEAQLADAVKQLEDVESQRSSLALQITHLEQDLHAAKGEVAEAESRYSILQSQQLAAMSTTEQLRTLRKQIEDQEQRVLRRNEQIGIHQHDIRRLETNLKLQEERVMEMTGELETAEAEKLAMIEDCRTTREERDEALKRCERLEESAEVLEETVASMGRQRDVELTSMVGVVVTSSAKRRQISVSYSETLLRYRTKIAQLSAEAQEARQSAAAALSAAEHQTTLYQATLAQLDSVQEQLRLSEMERLDVGRHNTQATVALVTVLRDLRQSASASESFRGQALSLQEELAECPP